ncbi:unnamed protein product, partial [Pelagomonas calceolata]
LVISVAGPQGDEVYFKVKPTTLLQKIFDAYANRKGVAGDRCASFSLASPTASRRARTLAWRTTIS